MDSNRIDALTRLAEESAHAADAFTQAPTQVGDTEARSEGGAVGVRLDQRGTVTEVVIAPGWRSESAPEELGALVVVTNGEAQGARLGAVMTQVERGLDTPVRHRPLPDPDHALRPAHGRAGDATVAAAMEQLRGLRDSIRELRADLETAARTRYDAPGPAGRATATSNGQGELVGLALDEQWLSSARPGEIGAEITAAIRAAHTASSASNFETIISTSRIGELQRQLTR